MPPRKTIAAVIQPEPLKKHVAFLASPAMEGRGSPESRRVAATLLKDQFEELKLEPLWGRSYYQDVPGIRKEDGSIPIWGRNVGGLLPGSDPKLKDEILILGVHYDHLGMKDGKIYAGADDNASSVAMMLEVARQISSAPQRPSRSIAFVGFDLEEYLLWGSKWFAGHPPWPLKQVKLFITADLIGRTLGDLPFPAVFVMGSERGTGLVPLLSELSPPGQLELARLGADIVGTRSDYGPFRDEKIPFLFFSSGEHPDYHTPQDTPDKIDYQRLANISNVVLTVLNTTANTTEPPSWIEKPMTDLEEARSVHRVTVLLQQADKSGQRRLTALQSFVVSQAHNKTKQILQKGELSADDRAWLVRSAQAMLFSVF